MIKILYKFRLIINKIVSIELFNNKFFLKLVKKIYSFFFTRKGIKHLNKYAIEIDYKIRNILLKYGGYMGCGNCLFIARNETSFGKNDLDYCVQNVNSTNLDRFIFELKEIGFQHTNTLYHNREPIELKFSYKKTYFDIFLLKKENDYCISKTILLNKRFPLISTINNKVALIKCTVVEQKWPLVKECIEKEMYNHYFLIPKNYEEYLIWQYGYNWKTPIKNFDFLNNPSNNLPLLYNEEGIIVYEENN